ncbi:hypothetical protein MFU01_56200 [Myxococcus fulvus]|uniref:Uncharacterized protein n=1 Tax=Myxococcus fulvus TaxID=33 RepID=A0A511TAG0_MYXFU|nr:hypothetical protein MFU01_56200 [Myxococcus fulvus]
MEQGECLECGQPAHVELAKGVFSVRCAHCGYGFSAFASPSLEEIYASRGPLFSVKVGWGGGAASVRQVFAMRQLVLQLKELSVGDARSMLAGMSEWPFPDLSKSGVDALVKRVEALGLTARVEPMPEEP